MDSLVGTRRSRPSLAERGEGHCATSIISKVWDAASPTKRSSGFRNRKVKWTRLPQETAGTVPVARMDQVREYNYALSRGRCMGSEEPEEEREPFEELFPELLQTLERQFAESRTLQEEIGDVLAKVIPSRDKDGA